MKTKTEIITFDGSQPLIEILNKPCRFVVIWRSDNDNRQLWSDTGVWENGELYWCGYNEAMSEASFDWLTTNCNAHNNNTASILVDWEVSE